MAERSDYRSAAWIALLLYAIYLLSFSGRFYSQDSMLMFSVTASFVKRGEFNADQMWTIYKARDELGPDGEAYSKTGYGASLIAAPLYAASRRTNRFPSGSAGTTSRAIDGQRLLATRGILRALRRPWSPLA